jgi:hypothetical protein
MTWPAITLLCIATFWCGRKYTLKEIDRELQKLKDSDA